MEILNTNKTKIDQSKRQKVLYHNDSKSIYFYFLLNVNEDNLLRQTYLNTKHYNRWKY